MALEIKRNELLKNHSTFRIGGEAKYFVVVKSKEELIEAVNFAKEKNLPYFILGGGSNMLYRDKGFEGVAIKSQISNLKSQNCVIESGSGVLLSKLINFSIENNLTGLEWGIGIPGTVGGGIAGNCGAYGHSIYEKVESITVLDEAGKIKKYLKNECGFGYRESRFKNSENKEIILEIEFKLEKGDKEESRGIIRNISSKRSGKIPPYPSAGSVFKNIIIDELKNKDDFLGLILQEKIKGGKFPISWLVESCGLKGKQIGGAKIAEEHANFIVNINNAKSDDVLNLIKLCKDEVKKKFNIDLEEEIIVV